MGELTPEERASLLEGFRSGIGARRARNATLTNFLFERIAEDEAAAQAELALNGSGTQHPLGSPFDPARVLARCEADRRIVERFVDVERIAAVSPPGGAIPGAMNGLHYAVQTLATTYADHPDYRPEWRP